jgi:type II secretory pathway component GspD/PulD (secretin)
MKTKLPLVILSLAASSLVSLAQDYNSNPADAPPPAVNRTETTNTGPIVVTNASGLAALSGTNTARTSFTSTNATSSTNSTAGTQGDGDSNPTGTPADPAIADGAVTNTVVSTNAAFAAGSTNTVVGTNGTAIAENPAEAAGAAADDVVPLIVIEDVPLTDAIRNLARQSNLNFQFDPRLTAVGPDGRMTNQPNVSIRFENVTAQEALNAVLENYNLALIKDPKSKIARITVRDPKAEDPLVSRIVQLRYSDPTNIVSLVKTSLSPRSSVVADTRTSQLILNTTEKEVENAIALIAKLDTPTRQVLIEAKLIETAINPQTMKGIDWSGTFEQQHFEFGNNTPDAVPFQRGTPGTVTVDPFGNVTATPGTPSLPAIPSRVFDGTPRLTADTAAGFSPATAFLNADGVSAVLSFLNKDNDSQVVATPRAVTLDNQTATLSVTRAFPIFLITPGSANSAGGSQVTYTNLGTILNVTPRIAADKNIAMRVVPEVSNIDGIDRQSIFGQINTANIYAIRKIETHVMIPSGNTLVMGGMLNDTQTKGFVKVPILGDIPGLGWLFRHESKNQNKQNLMIFITPTIVESEDFRETDSGTQFLRTQVTEQPQPKETAWDSAHPHDWSKPSH